LRHRVAVEVAAGGSQVARDDRTTVRLGVFPYCRLVHRASIIDAMDRNRMVFLGFGKYARADKIYAVEPIRDERRGHGRRTLVWVEGVAEPLIASRTERTILHDMGQDSAGGSQLLDQALDLAERVAEQTQQGRVDVNDLGRRARRLLEATAKPDEPEKLF
jgi:hypothetical protein